MNVILLEPQDFIAGTANRVLLTGRRAEHIRTVCRPHVGDTLRVGLLQGNMGLGLVERLDNTQVVLTVTLNEKPPQPLDIVLILALPRPKSLKKSLEVATTLGIKKIVIIGSWRVEKSYWSTPVLSPLQLRHHCMLGLEQARDTILPNITLRQRFKPFVEDELAAISANTRALVAHPYNAELCPVQVQEPVTLVIGPEGGFIPYEVTLLQEHGFTPVALGTRVLRVEQAIAAFVGRLLW